jgi:glycosyltransferase involved in cell wall biosynthesis
LVERGHQVTVYCRQRHSDSHYFGVSLQYLPTIHHKYLDTIAHSALSTLHLLAHRHDVVLYCNAANAIFTWMPRVFGMRVALNVDGLERNRKKWNSLARAWYRFSEWLATFCPNAMVTDAVRIREYYREEYRCDSTFIAYGAAVGGVKSCDALRTLGLSAKDYFLYVSRMELENNALLVRETFEKVKTDTRLALIGDAPYAGEYIRRVRETSDPRIVIPGAIYGQGYHELQSHCLAYIHATEVGGTHPALIEAMGRGALILYLDTPENAEVAGGVGLPFEPETLQARIEQVLSMDEPERDQLRSLAVDQVRERYSWDAVTTAYERLFQQLWQTR